MVLFSRAHLYLFLGLFIFVTSCGYNEGNSPGGVVGSTAGGSAGGGGGGGGPVYHNLSSVGADSCNTIDVSS